MLDRVDVFIFFLSMTTFNNAKRTALAAASIAFFSGFSVQAIAQNTTLNSSTAQGSATKLAPVVVTATRSETRANEITSDVTVIDRKTIEQHKGRTFAELLTRAGGVQIANNGGRSSNTSIFVRGTETEQTLLLIDGVPYRDVAYGAPAWGNLSLASIDRIEILKGPASALYGSSAIGGVIQIFTRKGKKNGLQGFIETVLSDKNYHNISAGINGKANTVSYSVTLETEKDDSQSATNSRAGSNYNPDRDPYERLATNISLDWAFTDNWSLGFNGFQSDNESDYDSGKSKDRYNKRHSAGFSANLKGKLTPNWQSNLMYAKSRNKYQIYDRKKKTPNKRTYNNTTNIHDILWQNTHQWHTSDITWGLESIKESTEDKYYKNQNRQIDSVFAGINGKQGIHHWQANIRHDSNSDYGDVSTYFASYGINAAPNTLLHAAFGTSFKAPTLGELHGSFGPNPNLKPEKGRNWEIGAEYYAGAHTFGATYFDNKVNNLIEWFDHPSGDWWKGKYKNISNVKFKGVTLSYKGQFGSYSAFTNFDWLSAKNQKNKKQLARRAQRQLTAGVDYTDGIWNFGTSVLAVSERRDTYAPNEKLGGYGLMDAYVGYNFNRNWNVQLKLNNIGDKQYETAYGYNQPGRSAYLTLRYQGE